MAAFTTNFITTNGTASTSSNEIYLGDYVTTLSGRDDDDDAAPVRASDEPIAWLRQRVEEVLFRESA